MSISLLSNPQFISKIIQDVDTGRRFVPLIGSGLSSPSGIIMGMEFTNYLAFTTFLVLSNPKTRHRTHGEGETAHWDLRHQGWPPLPSEEEVRWAREWILNEFKAICPRYDLIPRFAEKTDSIVSLDDLSRRTLPHDLLASLVSPQVPSILASAELYHQDERYQRVADVLLRQATKKMSSTAAAIDHVLSDTSRSYRDRLVEIGIRSLHDWRETLTFLSSIEVSPSAVLKYGDPQPSIIDRFNAFITRDKHPNLGHKMLAHLFAPMRMSTLLTTNFDSLTETAFWNVGIPIRVIPVSTRGHLPDPQTVASDSSLIKLHGELQDTRADMTLGEEPSEEDHQHFISYLTRGAGNLCRVAPSSESKRMLVLGYSGSDHRCVQMIKKWLEQGPEKPVLYWTCYSKWDVEKVKRLFGAEEYSNRVRVTRCSRPDLLLYELYQRLVLSLPPGGLTYEFTQNVPPLRLKEFDHEESQVSAALSCSQTMEHPLEAAHVLLPDSPNVVDEQQLCRDSAVLELSQLILSVLDSEPSFYDQADVYRPIRHGMSSAGLWRPVYRLSTSDGGSQLDYTKQNDSGSLKNLKARPVVIDSTAGVVRAAALAVNTITASTSKRVFWFESEDYMDADGLLRDLLRTLAVRSGNFLSRQVTQHPLDAALGVSLTPTVRSDSKTYWDLTSDAISRHLNRTLEDYRLDAANTVIMIYGRDSYGGCSGITPSPWTDQEGNPNIRSFQGLHCIIEALGRSGVPVIYFPLVGERARRKKQSVMALTGQLTVDESEHIEKFRKSKSRLDKWEHWPSDPFYFDPGGIARKSKLPTDRSFSHDHGDARSTSVFEGIIDQVLQPYLTHSEGRLHLLEQVDPLGQKENKLTFLYALTLFRHSRHMNSLCSEAAFQCPHRFNAYGVDNDFVRSELIVRWISELREARVFLDKPGGSVWMHRDIRLTLQCLLERVDLHKLFKSDSSGKSRHRFLHEKRSRLHFWIGDWYHKAFLSSGHLTPVIESLHHRVMSALYSSHSTFKNVPEDELRKEEVYMYRVALLESSLLEAQKTLHAAWNAMKLWQASPFEVSWLGEGSRERLTELFTTKSENPEEAGVIPAICSYFANDDKKHEQISERLLGVFDSFLTCLKSLDKEMLLDGGGIGGRNASPEPNPSSSVLNKSDRDRAERSTSNSNRVYTTLPHDWMTVQLPKVPFDKKIGDAFEGIQGSKLRGAIDDIAGVALSGNPTEKRESAIKSYSREKAKWVSDYGHDNQRLHDMIWLLSEYAYLMLRRAKLKYHEDGTLCPDYWIRGTVACNLGVDLCKHLPPSLMRHDMRQKVKCHTLYGVSLANVGRFFESARHFIEAQAILSKMPDRSPTELAIIQLRKAEALITEAFWTRLLIQFKESNHGNTCSELDLSRRNDVKVCSEMAGGVVEVTSNLIGRWLPLQAHNGKQVVTKMYMIESAPESDTWSLESIGLVFSHINEGHPFILAPARIAECFRKSYPLRATVEGISRSKDRASEAQLREKWVSNTQEHLHRVYLSLLDEAVTYLDRAEQNMSGHTQSSLWWSRLSTLRLRVYGLLYLLGDKASECRILRKQPPSQGIVENFRSALRISRDDPFRQMRTLKYFFEAEAWHRQSEPGNLNKTRIPIPYADACDALQNLVKRTKTDLKGPDCASIRKAIGDLQTFVGKMWKDAPDPPSQ